MLPVQRPGPYCDCARGERGPRPRIASVSVPSALQVGCADGTVAVWRLQPDGDAGEGNTLPVTPVLLSHATGDPSPLLAVAWAPPALAASAPDGLGRAIFMAAGHQGAISIWDAR